MLLHRFRELQLRRRIRRLQRLDLGFERRYFLFLRVAHRAECFQLSEIGCGSEGINQRVNTALPVKLQKKRIRRSGSLANIHVS